MLYLSLLRSPVRTFRSRGVMTERTNTGFQSALPPEIGIRFGTRKLELMNGPSNFVPLVSSRGQRGLHRANPNAQSVRSDQAVRQDVEAQPATPHLLQ